MSDDHIQNLDTETLKKNYEFLSNECEKYKNILDDLGLLDLVSNTHSNSEEKDPFDPVTHLYTLKANAESEKCHNSIEKLQEEINYVIKETKRNEEFLNQYSNVAKDTKVVRKKTETYESKFNKTNEKFPWLKDPTFDSQHIHSQMEKLKNLRVEKQQLEEDIKNFCGLEPSVPEAMQQLNKIKKDYEGLLKEFNKMNGI